MLHRRNGKTTSIVLYERSVAILHFLIFLMQVIGGFNQRQGEALPHQIFLTLKFVVCIALKIIEIVAT